jgi:hypothetical protein
LDAHRIAQALWLRIAHPTLDTHGVAHALSAGTAPH